MRIEPIPVNHRASKQIRKKLNELISAIDIINCWIENVEPHIKRSFAHNEKEPQATYPCCDTAHKKGEKCPLHEPQPSNEECIHEWEYSSPPHRDQRCLHCGKHRIEPDTGSLPKEGKDDLRAERNCRYVWMKTALGYRKALGKIANKTKDECSLVDECIDIAQQALSGKE